MMTHTETPIQDWINTRLAQDDADSYRVRAGIDQALFARDCLHPLLVPKYEIRKDWPLMVVGTHRSKSCVLPVIRMRMDGRGHGVQWRNNFYNYSISCKLADYMPWVWDMQAKPDERVTEPYCEGFPDGTVFGTFEEDPRQFTMQVHGSPMYPDFTNGMMFTWCFLFGRWWNSPHSSEETE